VLEVLGVALLPEGRHGRAQVAERRRERALPERADTEAHYVLGDEQTVADRLGPFQEQFAAPHRRDEVPADDRPVRKEAQGRRLRRQA
jgi:hypothetical protein